MVLAAYGDDVPTERLRDAMNRIQGVGLPSDGVALETVENVARDYGVETFGLRTASRTYARWSFDDVRREVTAGRPVITLVHYQALPWNESKTSSSDHYVVIVGLVGRSFLANDPALPDDTGSRLTLTEVQLDRAWAAAGAPGEAVAFGPGPKQLPLPVAQLAPGEWSPGGAGPVETAEPAASPTPVPSATPTVVTTATVATRTAQPTRTPAPDRWGRAVAPAPAASPTHDVPTATEQTSRATGDPLVLADESPSRDPRLALGILAVGIVAGAVVLRRSPRR